MDEGKGKQWLERLTEGAEEGLGGAVITHSDENKVRRNAQHPGASDVNLRETRTGKHCRCSGEGHSWSCHHSLRRALREGEGGRGLGPRETRLGDVGSSSS